MLDYGKPKPRAANFFGMALVRSVKAFKNAFPVGCANANAGIAYADGYFFAAVLHFNINFAVVFVVFYRIIDKVIQNFA